MTAPTLLAGVALAALAPDKVPAVAKASAASAAPPAPVPWTLAVGALLVGLALLTVLVPLFVFGGARRRAVGRGRLVAADRGLSEVADRAGSLAERVIALANRGPAIHDRLERAGLDMKPSELVVVVACAIVVAGVAGGALISPLVGLAAAAGAIAASSSVLDVLARRRRQRFAGQLGDALQVLAGALRAGYALMQAFEVVAQEAEAPMSAEFRRMTVEVRLGRDLAGALRAMGKRVGSVDFDWVVQSFEIHREVGGDLAEVLDNVGTTLRDRDRVRRQARALSAEGRLSAIILFVLPLVLAGIMELLNPGYLHELIASRAGLTLLGVAGVMLLAGGAWLHRIVKIDF